MKGRLELAQSYVTELHRISLDIEAHFERRVPRAEMRAVYSAFRAHAAETGMNATDLTHGLSLLDRLSDLLPVNGSERDSAVLAASALPGVRLPLSLVEARLPSAHFSPARALYLWSKDVFSGSIGYSVHILQSRDESVLDVTEEEQLEAVAQTQAVLSGVLQAAVEAKYPEGEVRRLIEAISAAITN